MGIISARARGEMDITTVFGTVVVGSNPAERTRLGDFADESLTIADKRFVCYNLPHCGYGLVVEYVLAKDGTRVRFSLPAPRFSEFLVGLIVIYSNFLPFPPTVLVINLVIPAHLSRL